MKTNYVTVIGSLNYDFLLKVNSFPLCGETKTAESIEFACGGKGANQAYQIGKLDIPIFMLGSVGNDEYGQKSLESLNSVNVDTSYVQKAECNTGMGFVTILDNGDVSAIISKGANNKITRSYIDENIDLIKGSSVLVLQLEIPVDVVEYIIDIADECHIKIILNAAPAIEIDNSRLKKVNYLVVNEVEAAYYLNCNISEDDLIRNLFKIRQKVKDGVILTLGSKGSYYYENDMAYIPIVKTNAVDTTGAGDSYIGAFVYGIYNGLSGIESCKLGALSSSVAVSGFGREAMPSLTQLLHNK